VPDAYVTGDKAEKYVIHHDRCIDCSVCAHTARSPASRTRRASSSRRSSPGHPQGHRGPGPLHRLRFCIDICPFDCIYLIDDPLHETFHKSPRWTSPRVLPAGETVCEKDAIFVPNPITQAKRYLPVL
jgi:formate hydrogenlyase subunit 6/NADH:ubiquinone oxidoreductase subunit I